MAGICALPSFNRAPSVRFDPLGLRPHAVGRPDVAAGEIEQLAVGRMVGRLDPLDMRPDRRMALGEEFCEFALFRRRSDDQDRACVGDRLGDVLEEGLVLGDPMTRSLLAVMDVADSMVRADDSLVRLLDVEMENPRPAVVDPDDRMEMTRHVRLLLRSFYPNAPLER